MLKLRVRGWIKTKEGTSVELQRKSHGDYNNNKVTGCIYMQVKLLSMITISKIIPAIMNLVKSSQSVF